MAVKKSIAIIGEGETEWWYFETLRVAFGAVLLCGSLCLSVLYLMQLGGSSLVPVNLHTLTFAFGGTLRR